MSKTERLRGEEKPLKAPRSWHEAFRQIEGHQDEAVDVYQTGLVVFQGIGLRLKFWSILADDWKLPRGLYVETNIQEGSLRDNPLVGQMQLYIAQVLNSRENRAMVESVLGETNDGKEIILDLGDTFELKMGYKNQDGEMVFEIAPVNLEKAAQTIKKGIQNREYSMTLDHSRLRDID